MTTSLSTVCLLGALVGGLICPTSAWLYRPFYFPLNLNYLFPTVPTTTTTTTAATTTTATTTTRPPVQISAGFISGQLAAAAQAGVAANLGGYPIGYPGISGLGNGVFPGGIVGGGIPGAQLGGGIIGGIARPPLGGIAGGAPSLGFGQFGGAGPYPVIGGLASPNGK